MEDLVLVLNGGSSSLKFSVYRHAGNGLQELCAGRVEELMTRPLFIAKGQDIAEKQALTATGHEAAVSFLGAWLREKFPGGSLQAVGHRVVHGGDLYDGPVLLTPPVVEYLRGLIPLVPLHQPHNLAPAEALMALKPDLPQVACFDTAFHRTMPRLEQLFALPRPLIDAGVRRYGFHGLSYTYVSRRLRSLDPGLAERRLVIAHLGAGASMCALRGRCSVATTMGFTGLDGLPMGTRCGSIDPGVLLYLMQSLDMDAEQIEDILYNRSGLLGVSGISGDMRVLLESESPAAHEAVDLFVLRVARELASLAAALDGLDGLVFTAGIGERSPAIRERVCRKAAWLGIDLDAQANREGRQRISSDASKIPVLVVATDENRVIAEQAIELIG